MRCSRSACCWVRAWWWGGGSGCSAPGWTRRAGPAPRPASRPGSSWSSSGSGRSTSSSPSCPHTLQSRSRSPSRAGCRSSSRTGARASSSRISMSRWRMDNCKFIHIFKNIFIHICIFLETLEREHPVRGHRELHGAGGDSVGVPPGGHPQHALRHLRQARPGEDGRC